MALCSKCGKELADDAQFCPSCGTPVNGAAKEKTNVAAGKAKEIGGKIKAAIDKLPFNDLARKYADFANYAVCVLGVVLLVVVISVITPNKKGEKSKSGKTVAEKTAKKEAEKAAKAEKKESSKKKGDKQELASVKGVKTKKEKAATGMELATVPAAEFTLKEGDDSKTSVKEFLIARTETTYAQWYEVLQWAKDEARGDKRYRFKNSGREGSGKGGITDKVDGVAPTGDSNHPVTMISYKTAIVWCNALSEKAGLTPVYCFEDGNVIRDENKIEYTIAPDFTKDGYRLPTCAEWLLAAKGGKPGSYEWDYKYAGSDTASEVGWFRDECGWQQNIHDMNEYSDEYGTKPVATKKANTLGLYDMSGNVNELVYDDTKIYCYGDSWYADASRCTVSNRYDINPDFRNDVLGFRLVRNAN